MTFGPDESNGARVTSVEEFRQALDIFQGRGYHEVDTARFYGLGTQEDYTRQAGWKHRHLKLATKIQYPFQHGANAYDKVIESLETSLKVLDTDKIDIVYLHAAVCFTASLYTWDKCIPGAGA
jgi:aflatoxin B1 aldehyde reductase